jgi:hypothetical protein
MAAAGASCRSRRLHRAETGQLASNRFHRLVGRETTIASTSQSSPPPVAPNERFATERDREFVRRYWTHSGSLCVDAVGRWF